MDGYTTAPLQRQREIASAMLAADHDRLATLHQIPEDVRANHRLTITMRIDHYTRRIAAIDEALRAAGQ